MLYLTSNVRLPTLLECHSLTATVVVFRFVISKNNDSASQVMASSTGCALPMPENMLYCMTVFTDILKFSVPTLTHVIPSQGRCCVLAVTSLDDDVFVVRYNSPIEVYDAVTFTLKRHITVPGFRPRAYRYGIVACVNANTGECLYLSNYDDNSVNKIHLSGISAVKWSVASGPVGLSVNKADNLVVSCCTANKIQEYTTDGSLVREICLQADVTSPWHAAQLSTGDYVVSQYTSPGVVSVVRMDGQVVRIYGQSYVGEMRYPTSLAVTTNDDILVADQHNDRILSINSLSGCVEAMDLSVDGRIESPRTGLQDGARGRYRYLDESRGELYVGIQEPCGLHLDESRCRLYVGEFGESRRILVIDGVRV